MEGDDSIDPAVLRFRLGALDRWRKEIDLRVAELAAQVGQIVTDRDIERAVNLRLRQERSLHLTLAQKGLAAGYAVLSLVAMFHPHLFHDAARLVGQAAGMGS